MAGQEDLISLDVIESHKENIQSLPGGRSAKALFSAFSLPASSSVTGDINESVRQGFEEELLSISEADDPLDIYDRYVKWTLDAYPSAQATAQSRLLPLLERSTKVFLTSAHYKNDPRYLKLWLHYIRLFSDSPKETFAFLARHHVGEGLALFYEEFAAWLEHAGRWGQAEEIYRLGVDREARPVERLIRKFAEFENRSARLAPTDNGPSSPVLPTVRPALAAKADPFATTHLPRRDPQAPTTSTQLGRGTISELGRQKLEIFADGDESQPPISSESSDTKGWESIGSIAHRKKENVVEARPWAGETLKAGKKTGSAPKMMIFKDECLPPTSKPETVGLSSVPQLSQMANPRTGRTERVFVNLEAVYPGSNTGQDEMSFEELRAAHRGWLGKKWDKGETHQQIHTQSLQIHLGPNSEPEPLSGNELDVTQQSAENLEICEDQGVIHQFSKKGCREGQIGRSKKLKIIEIKGETQTVKTNLDSPTKPLMRRKSSTEPTMTLHTRAATDEIYNIFNQPLKNPALLTEEAPSGPESDDEEDDYASAGESTATGKLGGGVDFDEEQPEEMTASVWSDFTTRKHIPYLGSAGAEDTRAEAEYETGQDTFDLTTREAIHPVATSEPPLVNPTDSEHVFARPTFVPIPPQDYEPLTGSYRETSQSLQGRPPFMTPIVERTESSLAPSMTEEQETRRDLTTPSRATEGGYPEELDYNGGGLMSNPFQEIINEVVSRHQSSFHPALTKSVKHKSDVRTLESLNSPLRFSPGKAKRPNEYIIRDEQCNPTDEGIRKKILETVRPSLSTYRGFFDRRDHDYAKSLEIRKFIKATKALKSSNDKTSAATASPPRLRFEGISREYTVKRELGKGAFAPVYLVETSSRDDTLKERDEELEDDDNRSHPARRKLEAIKMEETPSAWEFYIMRQAKERLASSRAADSVIHAYEMHLFADECYLIEEYRDQGTLLDLINAAKNDPSSSTSTAMCSSYSSSASTTASGIMDESLVIFFTVELLRTVEGLHSAGLLHGDLKADNCLLRLDPATDWSTRYKADGSGGWSHKGISLIDFGRGIDMRVFRPDVGFVADWPTGPEDCIEMREDRLWTYQVDYHGLAAIVHTMLFGKYIETTNKTGRYRPTERFKRYWQVELWTDLFDLLLNSSSSSYPHVLPNNDDGNNEKLSPLTMMMMKRMIEIRQRFESWLEDNCERGEVGLKGMLRRLERTV